MEGRTRFLSEKVILQYLGYIQTHMAIVEKGKLRGQPQEAKKLYSVRGEGGRGEGGGRDGVFVMYRCSISC